MKRRGFLKGLLAAVPVAAASAVPVLNKKTQQEIDEEELKKNPVKVLPKKLLCIDDEIFPETYIDFQEPDVTYFKVKDSDLKKKL